MDEAWSEEGCPSTARQGPQCIRGGWVWMGVKVAPAGICMRAAGAEKMGLDLGREASGVYMRAAGTERVGAPKRHRRQEAL